MRALLAACAIFALAGAVDRSKFRKCADTSFCRRHRDTAPETKYRVAPSSINVDGDHSLQALLEPVGDSSTPLRLTIGTYEGVARIRVTESVGEPRWEVPDVLVDADRRYSNAQLATLGGQSTLVFAGVNGDALRVELTHDPFRVRLLRGDDVLVDVNSKGLFHFEQRRTLSPEGSSGNGASQSAGVDAEQAAAPEKEIVDWGEDGKPIYADGSVGEAPRETHATADSNEDTQDAWTESWGGHTDSKPHGPSAVAADISFPGAQHVYGIPEHAAAHNLKSTDGGAGAFSEPYRLYNLDVFEYELDEPMALYGSIPYMVAHSASRTVAAFWLNPSEAFVDVARDATGTTTHWVSESGIIDLFLLAGPTPADVSAQYARLTGTTQLPPKFALAYHQCRWNYKDERDVAEVDAKFEEHDFPYDVLWLDIEHTDGKRYFTWDKHTFPEPAKMQEALAARGRKMVTIIDPHIKRDAGYHIHSEAEQKGLYIKDKSGADFKGWCWPGDSSYLDFTSSDVRNWWAAQFAPDRYVGSTPSLFTWNDMNEPSVFNGPEVSMNKDALSLTGVEHREWHNLYGFYQQMATAQGQVQRSPGANARPFVLSRAFFAGSQRYGAIWTGDNAAEWSHLAASVPMLLTISVSGLPFAGADVGGFFKNPDTELMVRWYQAGAYQPFFRAHAHIETHRREPWLFGEDVLRMTRAAVMERYALLPLWYTLFEESHRTGAPVMRPMWYEFPAEESLFATDDQFMVGSALLVKPVSSPGQTSATVALPDGAWYDARTGAAVPAGPSVSVPAPLEATPVLQRGGSIVPRQMRLRRCSALMAADPYTLTVALRGDGTAEGELYLDDGETFDYQRGKYRRRRFRFADGALVSTAAAPAKQFAPGNTVERVVIFGLTSQPSSALVTDNKGVQTQVDVLWDPVHSVATVRKPDVAIAYDFTIKLNP